MKFNQPKGEPVELFWGDHWPGCPQCRTVDLDKPATLANSCVMGAQLVAEELAKRQAPVEKAKRQEVKEWAVKAGTFVTDKPKSTPTKYVE
jgi:hypothetical protein